MVAPLFYARGKKAGLLVRLVRWWMRDELAIGGGGARGDREERRSERHAALHAPSPA